MSLSEIAEAVAPLVAEFQRLRVEYYLGGSVASSTHGLPRATLDVDLVAGLAAEHVKPLVAALQSSYYIDAGMILDAIAREACFNLIYLKTSFKVDVFVAKTREYDRVALQRKQTKALDLENPGSQFFFASAEDVILSKLEWFRLGDEVSDAQWRDVIGVLKVQEATLDRSYLRKWATELAVADLLDKAWREAEVP
ncbi:MAG: hypothetical protein HQ567_20155 [Candidatus Nealsonbacteria bacterium]|nr:hypothetical protein [Candidatus Nealsonbacteria bacterium]